MEHFHLFFYVKIMNRLKQQHGSFVMILRCTLRKLCQEVLCQLQYAYGLFLILFPSRLRVTIMLEVKRFCRSWAHTRMLLMIGLAAFSEVKTDPRSERVLSMTEIGKEWDAVYFSYHDSK